MRVSRRSWVRCATAVGSVLLGKAQPQDGAKTPATKPEFPAIEGLTREVADFIVGLRYGAIPADVVDLGKKSILDGLGLALCGPVAEPGILSLSYVQSRGL